MVKRGGLSVNEVTNDILTTAQTKSVNNVEIFSNTNFDLCFRPQFGGGLNIGSFGLGNPTHLFGK